MKGIICGAVLALTITAAGAQQDVQSANYMLPRCKAFIEEDGSVPRSERTFCARIVQELAFNAVNFLPTGSLTCIEGVTLAQEVRVIVRYIEAQPQRMHESFKWLAVEALRAAWPCKR